MAIIPVTSPSDIKTTAQLAHKIWNQHYVPIIGQEQVDYMLEKIQSEEAIAHQISNGYSYFLLFYNGLPCGYLALVPDTAEAKMMLSKIYVDADFRGLHLGEQLLGTAIAETQKICFKTLWLTVNRYNANSINWYQKHGFNIVKEVKIDIGNGFVMDDYVMEKIM
mgnify:CR=1 FL=1